MHLPAVYVWTQHTDSSIATGNLAIAWNGGGPVSVGPAVCLHKLLLAPERNMERRATPVTASLADETSRSSPELAALTINAASRTDIDTSRPFQC